MTGECLLLGPRTSCDAEDGGGEDGSPQAVGHDRREGRQEVLAAQCGDSAGDRQRSNQHTCARPFGQVGAQHG